MARRMHIGMSVRGALRNGEWKRMHKYTTNNGQPMTAEECFDALCDELAQGHEIIPYSDECDNWDWKTGCRGHEISESVTPTPATPGE